MESKKTSNTDSYAVKPTSYAVMPKEPKEQIIDIATGMLST